MTFARRRDFLSLPWNLSKWPSTLLILAIAIPTLQMHSSILRLPVIVAQLSVSGEQLICHTQVLGLGQSDNDNYRSSC